MRVGKKPVIGLCGFYGHGNYGDELFLKVHHQNLGDAFELQVIPTLLEKPYFASPLKDLVSRVDAILIGGGDLMRPWGVDSRYFHRLYLEKPVFIAGLGVPITYKEDGAEQETEHSINRYREFLTHPNIKFVNVRDAASMNWIHSKICSDINVLESPDLVCGLALPEVVRKNSKIFGIATRKRPNVDDDYSKLQTLASLYRESGWRVRHIVLGTGITGRRDLEDSATLKIPEKELIYSNDLDEISHAIGECSAFASMKFHGTVVATMYGIPSVVLVPTRKNISFLERLGRDRYVSKFDSPDLIEKARPCMDVILQEEVNMLKLRATSTLNLLRTKLFEVLC